MLNRIVKEHITIFIFAFLIFCFGLLHLVKPDEEMSVSERRKLSHFPDFSVASALYGTYMEQLEDYVIDQFPFREGFRKMKAMVVRDVFNQKDVNGIYEMVLKERETYAVKIEYPMNKASLERAGKRFAHIYEKYLKDKNVDVFLAVIPDKNYFFGAKKGYPSMDYDTFYKTMYDLTSYMTPIDLTKHLTLEDYYRTDTHWRQECIGEVAAELAMQMGTTISNDYEVKELKEPFYGVYYGQGCLSSEGDTLKYCTNDVIENCRVYDWENDREAYMYDMDKVKGNDPYEMFLSGNLSLVTIENPSAETEEELVIFGDSFSRSLVPLIAEGYAKITLVDIRYISPEVLGRFIEFKEQDVLFLYSTLVLNNSETLK